MGDLWKRGVGTGGKVNAAAAASADTIEQQNEALLGSLQSKIAAMKQVTVMINEEVHEQNRALEQMQTGMGGADNMLTSALNKMGNVFSSNGTASVTQRAGIIVAIFLVLFFVIRLVTRGT